MNNDEGTTFEELYNATVETALKWGKEKPTRLQVKKALKELEDDGYVEAEIVKE